MKIELLEAIARQLVGDGQRPNVYITTHKGLVVTVSRDRDTAYKHWHKLLESTSDECALEDRLHGVLASREPDEDHSRKMVTYDDIGASTR